MAGKLGSDVLRGGASMEGGCRDILSVGQRVRFVGVCVCGRGVEDGARIRLISLANTC